MIDQTFQSVSQLAFDVAERGQLIVPCPLVSRGRPTYSSDNDSPDESPWIAVHAGVGPGKLLVSWMMPAASSNRMNAPVPSACVIETSSSSTNGRDGEWRLEVSLSSNTATTRAHVVEFDGQSWVRLRLEGGPNGPASPFEQLDLHDASDGTDDCWLTLGDARLTALARGSVAAGGGEPGWAELIHERYPGYFPALVDESRSDESPSRALARLNELLAIHSPARRVAIAFAASSIQSIDTDAAALDQLVASALHGGRLPVIARPPAARGPARDTVDAFNQRIATIERRRGLVPGPDLAAWFDAHPDQLDDDGHPSVEGRRAIARLWADAVDVWYVPQ